MNTSYIKPEIKLTVLDCENILNTWSAPKDDTGEQTVDYYLGKCGTIDDSDWDD